MSIESIIGLSYTVLLIAAVLVTYFATSKFKTTKFKADGEEAVNKKLLQMIDREDQVKKECDELRARLRQSGS